MKTNSKYGSTKVKYGGRTYDSKLEATYAQNFEWQKKAGEIKEIIPQYKLELRVCGVLICNYFVDFKIVYADDTVKYVEIKGFETALWKIKWKMAQAIYGKENFVLKR